MRFVPSGRRPAGMGVESAAQAILSTEQHNGKHAKMCVTLLAAGFVVGAKGISVKHIEKATNTRIFSQVTKSENSLPGERPSRTFFAMGKAHEASAAFSIIMNAVNRYKALVEGSLVGTRVPRMQPIDGVMFRYEPPPRTIAPDAAMIEYEPIELEVMHRYGSECEVPLIHVRRELFKRDMILMQATLVRLEQLNASFRCPRIAP